MKNQVKHGNLVLITPFKESDIIVLNDDELELLYVYKNWDRIKPIPLTEEWLLKLDEKFWNFVGFGTRIIYQDRLHPAIKIEQLNNDQWAFFFNDELIQFKEFLHDAQNIIFALTGEELKINL